MAFSYYSQRPSTSILRKKQAFIDKIPEKTKRKCIAMLVFEDIANVAWYLGNDASRNTTGAVIVVDGGMLAQLTLSIKRELWK